MRIAQRKIYQGNNLPNWLPLFPLLFLLVGLILLAIGARQIYQGQQSEHWPTVTGKIAVAELGKHIDRDSDNTTSSTTYSADISYDYLVDDVAYVNSAVHFGSLNSSDPSVARRLLQRYPVGKQVTVYYNPARPQQAVLEPGIQGSTWVLPGLGLIFSLVGSGLTWGLLRLFKHNAGDAQSPISSKLGATSATAATS
jgi:Protein of unknown function (DUF3592)